MYLITFGAEPERADSGLDVAVRFGQFTTGKKDIILLTQRFPHINVERELKRILDKMTAKKDLHLPALRAMVMAELDRLDKGLPKKYSVL